MPTIPQSKPQSPVPIQKGFSVFKSLILPLLILLTLLASLELFAQTQVADKILPLRSYGNYHTQFEIKWQKLEKFVEQNGGVDVILLGNSMVNTGIDPSVVSASLSASGDPLRVFNFGVEGLTIPPMVDLTSLLVKTYHPTAIIYFTEIRDYLAGNGDDVANSFLDNEWLQYRLGKKSFVGWCVEHSVALQRLLPLRNWARTDFLDTWLKNQARFVNTYADGYEPEIQWSRFTGDLPDPNDPKDQELFQLYGNYEMDSERLGNLHQLLSLSQSGTNVLISEFPVYPGFYEYFGGKPVYADYLSVIEKFVEGQGGSFLPPIDPTLIPLNGRSDDHHLKF